MRPRTDGGGILAILGIGFVAAEMMTLIVLATDTPTFPVFVMVSFFLPFCIVCGPSGTEPAASMIFSADETADVGFGPAS
jgi:hypothetical protein